jgi:hypothetical protein
MARINDTKHQKKVTNSKKIVEKIKENKITKICYR